jgi:hypothetical protein
MMKSICVTALCLCLSLLACGGSTPEPEGPQRPRGGDAVADGSADGGASEGQTETNPSDPETTEEVIETSGPLE